MLTLPPLGEEFLVHLSVVKGRLPKTIVQYRDDLGRFFVHIYAVKNKIDYDSDEYKNIVIADLDADFIRSIKRRDILEYFRYTAIVRNNNERTRARQLSAIKGFFKYLTVENIGGEKILDTNPASDIDSPRPKKSLPKYLTLEDSVKLLEAVKNDTASKTISRDYAIIVLFLNCGMRLSELCGINLSDLKTDLSSVNIRGKGNKERMIYLNTACQESISDYIKVRVGTAEIKDKNALFLSSRGSRISVKTVQWIVYKYLKLAGLEYLHCSTHKLRHTAATLMYQTGKVDVRILKDILGHEQLNTTQIYTHVSDTAMKKAMMDNPLSNVTAKSKENKD